MASLKKLEQLRVILGQLIEIERDKQRRDRDRYAAKKARLQCTAANRCKRPVCHGFTMCAEHLRRQAATSLRAKRKARHG